MSSERADLPVDAPSDAEIEGYENLQSLDETQLGALRSGSKSTDDWTANSPSARSSGPASVRSQRYVPSPQEQEQRIAEYLQGSGFALAGSKISNNSSESKGEELRRKIDLLREPQDELTASTPGQGASEANAPFKARRTQTARNWFYLSSSKTLPRNFGSTEGLQDSPLSNGGPLLADYDFSTLKQTKSASLRKRNSRLPPGYVLPNGPTSTIVASASLPNASSRTLVSGGRRLEYFEELLDASSPLENVDSVTDLEGVGAAPLVPDIGEDAVPVPLPLAVGRGTVSRGIRRPPDLTIDTTMSGALPTQEVPSHGSGSQRDSRFSEVLEEVDAGARPAIPPKSPARMSNRNSALVSNRGSIVFPMTEPFPHPMSVGPPSVVKKTNRSWWTGCLLAAMWASAAALTIFGISKISPLHQPIARTLREVQTCMPPSFSFVHTFRLNTTMPETLYPFLPQLKLENVKDISIVDRGVKVNFGDGGDGQEVIGSLVMGSAFSESGTDLVSNIIYTAVVDGGGDYKRAMKLSNNLTREAEAGQAGETAKVVSARGKRGDVTMTQEGSKSTGEVFLALWLACVLAVEMTLLVHFVVFKLLWEAASMVLPFCRSKTKGKGKAASQEESGWKREVSTISASWVLAGVLGSAAATGILIAFWN